MKYSFLGIWFPTWGIIGIIALMIVALTAMLAVIAVHVECLDVTKILKVICWQIQIGTLAANIVLFAYFRWHYKKLKDE